MIQPDSVFGAEWEYPDPAKSSVEAPTPVGNK
jgi:hypothetical protein